MSKIGERVGAILGTKGKTVEFLGYGIYEGDFPLEELGGMPNPRIKLDSGATTWGCECWWGSEQKIKNDLLEYEANGYSVVPVDIDQLRAPAD